MAVDLAILMLPYVVFVCAAALLGGILQVHRRFVATTATAVLLNLLLIVALVWAAWAHDLSIDAGKRAVVWWQAIALLVAGVAQVALLWPSLRACGLRVAWPRRIWTPPVREMLRKTLPVALGLGVLQIGVVIDKQLSLMLAPQSDGSTVGHFLGLTYSLPMETGALNRLDLAQYLYQFPLGVFGIAIATAIFPQLSGDALDRDRSGFRAVLARGIGASMFIGLPASVGMILIAQPAVHLLFEGGAFTAHHTELTARSTAIYSSVIWAFSVQQILNRGYYALGDMRTPLVWAGLNLLINLVVELPLLWTGLGESAMAVGTAASFLVQTTAMTALLARRVGLPLGTLWPQLWRIALATAAMALACWCVARVPWSGVIASSHLAAVVELGAIMAVGAGSYFATCLALRLPMESLIPARFTRRR